MSSSFGLGQVISVIGTGNGFLGEISAQGSGDPLVGSKQSNTANAASISVGDAVVLLPDSTGGTVKQFADWIAHPAGLAVTTNISSGSATATPTSLAGLAAGMLVGGTGVAVGTYISTVNYTAGTITLSQNATGTNASAALKYAFFYGVAVREVKTILTYNPQAGGVPSGGSVLTYPAGAYVGCLLRGAITIAVPVGTPTAGGPAYLRTVLNGGIPAGLVGSFEANSDTTNSILLAKATVSGDAYFKTGVKDSNNLTELVFTSRIQA